jgi:hypothetical protein
VARVRKDVVVWCRFATSPTQDCIGHTGMKLEPTTQSRGEAETTL